MNENFNLQRFVEAQDPVYSTVLNELCNGRKETHWMWFVFPQIIGLGRSEVSRYYAIKNIDEAKAYLEYPVLKSRLEECLTIVLNCNTTNPVRIFGDDSLKFHSCLTLFSIAAPDNELFRTALTKFYGSEDFSTEHIISNQHK